VVRSGQETVTCVENRADPIWENGSANRMYRGHNKPFDIDPTPIEAETLRIACGHPRRSEAKSVTSRERNFAIEAETRHSYLPPSRATCALVAHDYRFRAEMT